jgi:hypothetical protein
MASQDEARIIGGHTAKVLIGGKEVGFFFDLSYSVDFGLQDAPVLGQTTVVEHQQTRYIVSGEFRQYFIRDELVSPESAILPKTAAEAIRKGTFDLDVIDKVTGKVIIRLEEVSLASGSAGFSTGQLVSKRVSFRAINTRSGSQANG